MLNQEKDNLFGLIKSLTKSEKRQFKLYAGRLGGNSNAKFLALFNLLDKMKTYDDSKILKSEIVTKTQLPNLKAHLYKQILVSLRLNPSNQNIKIQIREQLDFATILYNKGLYKHSLKILEKAKNLALEKEEKNLAFEIIEFEKIIESQYITRSIGDRADELTVEAKEVSRSNVIASKLSNLSLQLYGILLKKGYVKNDDEFWEVTDYFNARLPQFNFKNLGFREKMWLYKSYLWYNFLIQDFIACYKYSQKLVQLFDEYPKMIELNPVFFLKSYHYLLESLYLLKFYSKFKSSLERLVELVNSDSFPKNDNLEVLSFLYIYNNKLNLHLTEGTFSEGIPLIEEVLKKINRYENRIDEHHIMLFYYKIACLYFGVNDYKNCILYLQKIIDSKSLQMREDLMCYSRILSLVAHYEAGLDYNFDVQLRKTYRFLIKMNDLYEVQKEFINFLRRIYKVSSLEIKKEFKELHQRLKPYENHPYESRAFLYLDILSWLESNIENRPVAEVMQEKFKASYR